MNLRNLAIWGAILVAAIVIYSVMQGQTHAGAAPQELAYSDLVAKVDQGDVARAEINGQMIDVWDKGDHEYRVVGPGDSDPQLQQTMEAHGVKFQFGHPGQNLLVQLLINMAPLILLFGLSILFMRQMQGGARGAMGFG